jgi:hypothetical protein
LKAATVGFKSDREFLRNVSIGAVGTRRIAAILSQGGFRIIELERYSSSNKIWATKIKRLRVPDLLCLDSGIRIECRAKADLKITMSHAVNNPDRAWDKGLRDNDIVAFIRCWPTDGIWTASDRAALFRVGDMRSTWQLAKQERMKSASEGSEVRVTWPATVPNRAGKVLSVSPDSIRTQLASGRQQSYRLARESDSGRFNLIPHVKSDDTFGDGDTILASSLPLMLSPSASSVQRYDFFPDLESDSAESAYVAVKALGFLPELRAKSRSCLGGVVENSPDGRIRLEAAASLARLGFHEGWDSISRIVSDSDTASEYRMESALILAEMPDRRSIDLLKGLLEDTSNDSELRAAGAWGLADVSTDAESAGLVAHVHDTDEVVAVHAILALSRLIRPDNIEAVLQKVGEDARQSAGLVRATLLTRLDFVPDIVRLIRAGSEQRRQWLLYLLACRGRAACGEYLSDQAPELLTELDFFWTHQVENWTNRLDAADQIEFLREQVLDQPAPSRS